MKIAFLGRAIHEQTKSDLFFIDLLKQVGDVTIWRRENLGSRECVEQVNALEPHLTVFFQLPPSLFHHLLKLRSKRKIWVPMWDGFQPLSLKKRLAYRLAGLEAISCCNPVHRQLKNQGIPSCQIRYFPTLTKSSPLSTASPYTFFLWQRDPNIGLNIIAKNFPPSAVRKVIYKSDLHSEGPVAFPIEKLEGWLPKEQLLQKIAQSDFYIAPRLQEGVGLSFLEAMAMGKIVLAHNDATMNEYIEDGRTGYLFNREGQFRHAIRPPAALQPALEIFTHKLRNQWLQDEKKLLQILRA